MVPGFVQALLMRWSLHLDSRRCKTAPDIDPQAGISKLLKK